MFLPVAGNKPVKVVEPVHFFWTPPLPSSPLFFGRVEKKCHFAGLCISVLTIFDVAPVKAGKAGEGGIFLNAPPLPPFPPFFRRVGKNVVRGSYWYGSTQFITFA